MGRFPLSASPVGKGGSLFPWRTAPPPRAYYRTLSATLGSDLDITLPACDPDVPERAAGMNWRITDAPMNGRLAGALSGTYSADPHQVTYVPAVAGTDRFYCEVTDVDGGGLLYSMGGPAGFSTLSHGLPSHASDLAVFDGKLFLSGADDSGSRNLMYMDGVTWGTVPGTAGQAPSYMVTYDNRLFYSGGQYPDIQLWYVDSTQGAPTRVSDVDSADLAGGLDSSGLVVYWRPGAGVPGDAEHGARGPRPPGATSFRTPSGRTSTGL
jgi:hypothetical protein